MAVKTVVALAAEWPDIHLAMIGPNKRDGSLERTRTLAEELGVNRYISFNEGIPKSKVPSVLNQADIFISTTNIDNTPVSILEAMACGLCIVSTNVGGIPYLLEHEKDALLVPPDNPAAMAHAVERILKDTGLAGKLSRNARQKAEQFDWAIVLPQWEKTLNSVLVNLPN